MKALIIGVLLFFPVVAQAQEKEITVEEKVFLQSFAVYVIALTYDEICNKSDPKARYDFSKKENVNLMGNQQMLAAQIGGLWHIRNPERSVDEGVEFLLKKQKAIEEKFSAQLKKDGCETKEAKAGAGALQLYTTQHPAMVMSMIGKTIKAQGGEMTPPDKMNAPKLPQ